MLWNSFVKVLPIASVFHVDVNTTRYALLLKLIGSVTLVSVVPTFMFPHCILIAFKEENYGEYGWSLKNLLLLEFNIYAGLGQFLKIRNAEITVFLSFLLETVVTTTKSQKIK